MSFQVDTALVNAYKANIDVQFQQFQSRLRGAVRVETQNAEYDYYDRIGPTDAIEVQNRHADTPLVSTPHDRRRCGLRDFDWADLIDKNDKIRMLADPTSSYVRNAVGAMNRAIDRVIIAAFTATAYTGKAGGTSTTFPAASEVAVDAVESGSTTTSNMTIGKLRAARKKLQDEEAGGMGEGTLYCVMGPSQLQALLRTTEVTSSDYNTVKALVNGEINTFLGINFIVSNLLTKDANNVRDCFVWERDGMLLAMGAELAVDVGPRRDKRNSAQVYVSGSFGSVRMWEEKVIRIKCDEDY